MAIEVLLASRAWGDSGVLGSRKDGSDYVNLRSLLESEGKPILLLGSQLLLRSEGDWSVKEGNRGSSDDTISTEGIDGGLAGLDSSGKIGLMAGNKTEGEDKRGRLNSSNGRLKLSRGMVEVNVKTSNGELGNEVDVGVGTTKVGGQEDFWGDRGKFSISGVELAFEL